MRAIDRFKKMLADSIERVCLLEEQLEVAQERIRELESQSGAKPSEDVADADD